MKGLLITKVFCDFSLVFGVINYLFPIMGSSRINSIIYIAISSLTCLIYFTKEKNKRWIYALIPSLFILFLTFRVINSIAYFITIFFCVIFFLFRDIGKIDYYSFMETFKKGIGLVAIIFGISIIRKNANIFSAVSAPYIIVYLVFSVVLLRTLRYMEYNKSSMDINKINLKYSAIITTLSLTISMKPIREFIFNLLYQIHNFIINMLFYLLSWPLLGIGYVMQFIVYFVKKIISTNARQQVSINVSGPPFEDIRGINRTDIIEFLMKNKLVNTLLQIIIFTVVIWLLIRIFGRQFQLKQEEEEYTESRDFIIEKTKIAI